VGGALHRTPAALGPRAGTQAGATGTTAPAVCVTARDSSIAATVPRGESSLEDDATRAAFQEREVAAEHRINLIRGAVVIGASAADLLYAWFAGTLSRPFLRFGGVVLVCFVPYWWGIHRLSRGPTHRPWLRYVTITADYALILGVFFAYQRINFFGNASSEAGAGEFISFLILFNFLSAFRLSQPAIVYSTVLASGVALAVAVAAGSLVFVVYAPLFLIGSGGLMLLLSAAWRDVLQRLRRREQLMRFLPRQVVQGIDDGSMRLQLGGVKEEATILLSDIRGFTTFAEDRDPDEVLGLLNQYFTRMAAVIWKYGGTIDKFIGDGLLAVFGVPVNRSDDAMRAVRAALAMQEALDDLNQQWARARAPRSMPRLRMGVALHTGIVMAGNIGSPQRMEYTVIGDAVNVTAHLEELNKEYHTDVLLSESTNERLDGTIRTEFVAEARVRGRHQPVRAYRPVV
jgi:adenylate cyclase